MLGSVGVLLAAVVIKFTGWHLADPIIAVLIGLWVLPRTWTLLREAGQILMQGVPAGLDLEAVRKAMTGHAGVSTVHDLHAWALGSREPVLTAHVVVDDAGDVDDVRQALTKALAEQFEIRHATLQVERTNCGHGNAHG